MNPWEPTEETRIYTDLAGVGHDPLGLRQDLVASSNGTVWQTQQRRYELAKAMREMRVDHPERPAVEVDLVAAERRIVGWARKAFGMRVVDPDTGEGFTEAEALKHFDHFLEWLDAKKPPTRA